MQLAPHSISYLGARESSAVSRMVLSLLSMTIDDRRGYPRLSTPAFWKPARLLASPAQLIDLGSGGVRVLSDEEMQVGDRLDLTLFTPEGEEIETTIRVAWVNVLPAGSEAAFDVGLHFERVAPEHAERLTRLVSSAMSDPSDDDTAEKNVDSNLDRV